MDPMSLVADRLGLRLGCRAFQKRARIRLASTPKRSNGLRQEQHDSGSRLAPHPGMLWLGRASPRGSAAGDQKRPNEERHFNGKQRRLAGWPDRATGRAVS